jgi:hypothetical protein
MGEAIQVMNGLLGFHTISDVVGCQGFGRPCHLHLHCKHKTSNHPEDGGYRALQITGVLPHHYMVSKHRIPDRYENLKSCMQGSDYCFLT